MDKIIGNDYIFNTRKVRLVAIEDPRVVYWIYDAGRYDWLHIANIAKLHVIDTPQDKKEPVTLSPIYTDEMRDNDILPDIGVNCMMSESRNSGNGYSGFVAGVNSGEEVYITAHFKTRTGLKMAAYFSANESKRFGGVACAIAFKAITPPIELIDQKAYQFDTQGKKIEAAIYFLDTDRFHRGAGYFKASDCTNIKLLEVN